jgi:hypothetical protein
VRRKGRQLMFFSWIVIEWIYEYRGEGGVVSGVLGALASVL